MKRGLEILGIALVDAAMRAAVALRAVQTQIKYIRKGRRPKCVAHIEKDSLVSHYLRAIYDYCEYLLQLSNIIFADAFFSNESFAQGLAVLCFELFIRLRDDVRLRYLYIGTKSKVRGCPKEFDGTIDLSHLLPLVTETYDWYGKDVPLHSALVYAVMLKRKLKVVIVEETFFRDCFTCVFKQRCFFC